MRKLPLDHPGTADRRSPGRYPWWLARGPVAHPRHGMFFGIVWMSTQAVMPFVLGRAIDRGVADRDSRALLIWAGVLLAIGLVQAGSGLLERPPLIVESGILAH